MMRALAAIALVAALCGCAESGIVRDSGDRLPPPLGYLEHCAIDPGPECGK